MHELMKWSKYTQAPNCSEMTRYRCGASCLSCQPVAEGGLTTRVLPGGGSSHSKEVAHLADRGTQNGLTWLSLAVRPVTSCDILWLVPTCARFYAKQMDPVAFFQLAGILKRYGLHWPYHNLEAEHGATGSFFQTSDVLKETKVFGLEEFYSILVSPRFCDQKCSRQLQFVEIALEQLTVLTYSDFCGISYYYFWDTFITFYNHPSTPSLPATQLLPSQDEWKFAQFPGWWDTSTGRPRTRRATLCSTMCFRAKCRCRKTPQKWRGKWRECEDEAVELWGSRASLFSDKVNSFLSTIIQLFNAF